eukprot:GFUD01003120.1.p1 GENE.GFUD01003120.1~~GFUD01003120.1.p1  ORF type:complete len:331 (-),score=50.31 GFUD01003120.1:196-1188(-)
MSLSSLRLVSQASFRQCLLAPSILLVSSRRGFQEVQEKKVAVVTGASRGVGYATAKELCNRLSSGHIYCTSRGATDHLNTIIKQEMGEKAPMVEFHHMEATDITSIIGLRNKIFNKHGQIDILINNAGMYFPPCDDPTEHFCQVENTLQINYWGLKNVCNAFLPMLSNTARIVNMSSHLGHLSLIPDKDIRRELGDPQLTEQQLDSLVLQYKNHCTAFHDDFRAAGWPRCAYTVSKVAVNAYTRILQGQLEKRGNEYEGVVVNSIHPGSHHSKISQDSPLTAAEAAKSVVNTALLAHPCQHPRGKFIWHDLKIVNWDKGTSFAVGIGMSA